MYFLNSLGNQPAVVFGYIISFVSLRVVVFVRTFSSLNKWRVYCLKFYNKIIIMRLKWSGGLAVRMATNWTTKLTIYIMWPKKSPSVLTKVTMAQQRQQLLDLLFPTPKSNGGWLKKIKAIKQLSKREQPPWVNIVFSCL